MRSILPGAGFESKNSGKINWQLVDIEEYRLNQLQCIE
jgi:hypothetical protein